MHETEHEPIGDPEDLRAELERAINYLFSEDSHVRASDIRLSKPHIISDMEDRVEVTHADRIQGQIYISFDCPNPCDRSGETDFVEKPIFESEEDSTGSTSTP